MSRHFIPVHETRQVHNRPMKYQKRINGKRRADTKQNVTYSPGDLARLLGIARNGVYSALRSGKIPHIRIGRRFVIPRAAVDAWLASPNGGRAEHSRSGAVELVANLGRRGRCRRNGSIRVWTRSLNPPCPRTDAAAKAIGLAPITAARAPEATRGQSVTASRRQDHERGTGS